MLFHSCLSRFLERFSGKNERSDSGDVFWRAEKWKECLLKCMKTKPLPWGLNKVREKKSILRGKVQHSKMISLPSVPWSVHRSTVKHLWCQLGGNDSISMKHHLLVKIQYTKEMEKNAKQTNVLVSAVVASSSSTTTARNRVGQTPFFLPLDSLICRCQNQQHLSTRRRKRTMRATTTFWV